MTTSAIKNRKALGFPWATQDPFLFCVFHEDQYPKGNGKLGPAVSLAGRNLGNDFELRDGFRMYHGKLVPGFPAHPHRGFETVTVANKGLIDHADSLGGGGRFGEGDVQWMTAGKGVQHSEMFPLLKEDEENPGELFQIWLNLPAKSKMVEPHYAMHWHEDIPIVDVESEGGAKTKIKVVAGQLGDVKALAPAPNSWAADPTNEVAIWDIRMEAGAEWKVPIASSEVNRSLFFFEGEEVMLNDAKITAHAAFELNADQEVTLKNGRAASRFLLLQGKPIGEPVAQYGPFVMNTHEELQEAFEDFQKNAFGGWPWPRQGQVHAKDKGRFAVYTDGSEEIKEA